MEQNIKLVLRYLPKSIVVDVIDTYPKELINLLKEYEQVDYYYPEFYEKMVTFLRDLNPKIAIFHNTNLIQVEIDDIEQLGIVGANEEFVQKRIGRVYDLKLIDDDTYKILVDNIAVKTQNPNEKVHVVLSVHTIWDDLGAELLLTIWGGESVYWYLLSESSLHIEEILSFGKPCIVVGCVDYDICDESKIIESIHYYYNRIVVKGRAISDIDGRQTTLVGPLKDVHIFVSGDGIFEQICDVIRLVKSYKVQNAMFKSE